MYFEGFPFPWRGCCTMANRTTCPLSRTGCARGVPGGCSSRGEGETDSAGPNGSSRVVFGVVQGLADLAFAADTATRFPRLWVGAIGDSTPPVVHGVADMLSRPNRPWTWQKKLHRKKIDTQKVGLPL